MSALSCYVKPINPLFVAPQVPVAHQRPQLAESPAVARVRSVLIKLIIFVIIVIKIIIRSEFASQFERISAEHARIAAEHEALAIEEERQRQIAEAEAAALS